MERLQEATPGAFAGEPETHELMDVGLDKDSCWLVALGSCPALQTDCSLYTELFVLQFSWCPRAHSAGVQAGSQLQNSLPLPFKLGTAFPG